MKRVTTVVIGAGQCGLAMSRELSRHWVDHLVLERGAIGQSWRAERWNSLRLLTPNWMNGPHGHRYRGSNPDGFMSCTEFADSLVRAAVLDGVPVQLETEVRSLEAFGNGYRIETDRGMVVCDSAVIATGSCATPRIPDISRELPPGLLQLSPLAYKCPADVPGADVLVVGASASGLQIARELAAAGRRVTLAVGNHLRLPRRYRDADIMWWMDRIGVLDLPPGDPQDAVRLRRLPSLPLSGAPAEDLDLNALQDMDVEIVGRLSAVRDGFAWFSGSLPNSCTSADLKLDRLLDRLDAFAVEHGLEVAPPYRLAASRAPAVPRLSMPLREIGAVVWATGYEPDHSWVKLPVFDGKGRIRHNGGVVADGLYVMGLRYLRTARSSHISGAGLDAAVLANHLVTSLSRSVAA